MDKPIEVKVSPGNSLRGEIRSPLLPGDKSISHRAILLGALAQGESVIDNLLVAGVTRPLLAALTALGVPWKLEGHRLHITGVGLHGFSAPAGPIDCGNSATTIRLLAGTLAAAGVPAVLDGTSGLRRRPMDRIITPLQAMGVPMQGSPNHTAPLHLEARPAGRPLKGIEYTLPVASAQVKSCLLLAGLAADGTLTIHEPGPSRDHTERMLSSMGALVEVDGGTVRLTPPAAGLQPLTLAVPGDFSAAAFLIVAALVTPGSEVMLRNIGLNPTRTGLLDVLLEMGGDIVFSSREQNGEQVGDLRVRHSRLHGAEIAGDLVVRMIDEFPIFAVAAAYANSPTLVRNAEELRFKESDRITALCQELRSVGVEIEETPDGFRMPGKTPPCGGRADAHGDHRLAMSLAVAGLASEAPLGVSGAEMTGESFPGFLEALQKLGAFVSSNGQGHTPGPGHSGAGHVGPGHSGHHSSGARA